MQETLRLEGRDIDLQARLWRMPAHKTKCGTRPHVIPLPEHAIPTLEMLIALRGDGHLFLARNAAKGAVMKHLTIMQALKR